MIPIIIILSLDFTLGTITRVWANPLTQSQYLLVLVRSWNRMRIIVRHRSSGGNHSSARRKETITVCKERIDSTAPYETLVKQTKYRTIGSGEYNERSESRGTMRNARGTQDAFDRCQTEILDYITRRLAPTTTFRLRRFTFHCICISDCGNIWIKCIRHAGRH